MQRIAIGFHDIAEAPSLARVIAPGHSTIYTLGLSRFREHLQAIRSGVSRLGVDPSRDQPVVLLTFDDGALSSYTHAAPELEKLQWPGHFFVTTDWIGRPGFLSCQQIRELHQHGHVIGSHSCSHPSRMSRLGWADLVEEWRRSCQILGDILGQAVRFASVPGGSFSSRVARAAAAAGIEVLFTSEPTPALSYSNNCLLLGRYAIRRNTSASVSRALAEGAKWPWRRQSATWAVKKAAKHVMGESYFTLRNLLLADERPRL